MRECNLGEAFTTSGAWETCEVNEEYLLVKLNSPGSCKACQAQRMFCNGGNDVGPKPGYWRSSNLSDNFIPCLHHSACLGYVAPTYNNLGECGEGYYGVLCQAWEVGYTRSGQHECSKCLNPVWNILILLSLLIVSIIVIVVIVRSTLNSATRRKNLSSVYIKILMSHLQLITLVASFQFNWTNAVTEFFETSGVVSNVSSEVISLDCLIDSRSENHDENVIPLYYTKMILLALLPIILSLIIIGFWIIYYCINKKQKRKLKGRIVSTLLIVFFLVYPTITDYMFSNFR